ncbi:MAG: ABC transporter permease [Gemmatimonadota bacterium]
MTVPHEEVPAARRALQLPRRTRARVRAAVDEELEFHLDMVVAELVAAGWQPADAEGEARRRFGDIAYTRDYCSAESLRRERGQHRMATFDELFRDLKFTARTLLRAPGFTLIVLFTLALGIGANTAIFSVVRSVLLEPLPFAAPDRLVRVWHANRADDVSEGAVSEPDYIDWRRENTVAESMGGFFFADGQTSVDFTGDGAPQDLKAALAAEEFFETLGTAPALGRTFTAEDQLEGRNRVVVLGYGLWESRFGSAPDIIGRRITLNGEPFSVVGVMPRNFTYPADQQLDVWIPLSYFGPDDIGRVRAARFLQVIARLKPGVTEAQFASAMNTISARLAGAYTENAGWESVTVKPMRESIVGSVQRPLSLLLGAVALVLLITCVNVASLLLTRASARERELAVRSALGAGRGRIIRQLLTESLTLALLGGALGVGLAMFALRALARSSAASLPRSIDLSLDGTVLAFTLVISLLSGLLFGLMPTLRVAGPSLEGALRGGRGALGKSGGRLRNALVIAQVALAVVLITAAGLTTKSLLRLLSVDMGFNPDNALVVSMGVPERYSTPGAALTYYESILEAIRQVPGVRAVGSVRDLPTQGNGEMRKPDPVGSTTVQPGQSPPVYLHHVSKDYFTAMEIPLKSGRFFEPTDREGAPVVFLVNETMAKLYWPGEDAVGKAIRMGPQEFRIVGVVGDVRQRGPAEAVDPQMFIHIAQNRRSHMGIVARTDGDPLALATAVRQAIWNVDKDQTISSVGTLNDLVGRAVSRPRLLASLLVLFGLLGLTLGALGIYGVLAFAVSQRRQEIGVRVALGASPRSVLGLVVGQGMKLSAAGVAIGIAGAAALAGTLQAVLFEMPSVDPATFAQTVAVLMGAALLASWLPARRALAIDPATALREE